MSIFNIDMLPAREGDCLWVEYGDPAHPRRIVVDGGRKLAWDALRPRFAALPPVQRKLDLLILSHVDADHIEGLLEMVADPDLPIRFQDVWFNGHRHLERIESLGAKQGEAFTEGIKRQRWDWNAAFNAKSVVLPDDGPLPVKQLPDGMRLTLLSPTWDKLEKLEPVWRKELEKAGLLGAEKDDRDPEGFESLGALTIEEVQEAANSDFEPDRSAANGSSIAVLAEFDGRSAVFTGDSHADIVAAALAKLRGDGPPIKLDAFKLSHHGSHGTHSADIMNEIDCKRFLVSTDGSRHKHPHIESIARTVANTSDGTELVFNYASPHTKKWDLTKLKNKFSYSTSYPTVAPGFIRTVL